MINVLNIRKFPGELSHLTLCQALSRFIKMIVHVGD